MSSPGDGESRVRKVPVATTTRALRVLIVEDDPSQQMLYSRALSNRGFEVECMSSGFGLVNKVAGRNGDPPDVLVLDNMLPALNGSSLLALLAKSADASKVPVLLHSAADPSGIDLGDHPRVRFIQKEGVKRLVEAVREATKGITL
jgi:CheY-like chemotaxis protein